MQCYTFRLNGQIANSHFLLPVPSFGLFKKSIIPAVTPAAQGGEHMDSACPGPWFGGACGAWPSSSTRLLGDKALHCCSTSQHPLPTPFSSAAFLRFKCSFLECLLFPAWRAGIEMG